MHHERVLIQLYGIDFEDWARLYARQHGECAGCRAYLDPSANTTHVDHCHETKQVRGLLCAGCNHALGKVKDSVETLVRLAVYLGEATQRLHSSGRTYPAYRGRVSHRWL